MNYVHTLRLMSALHRWRLSDAVAPCRLVYHAAPTAAPAAPSPRGPADAQAAGTLGERLESNTSRFSPEVIRLARRAVVDGNSTQSAYVESLLNGEIDQSSFLKTMEQLEAQEESWGAISKIQRSTREKIANLQSRTQSYVDVIPTKRRVFEYHLDRIRKLNISDARFDSSLKSFLGSLTKPKAAGGPPQLDPSDAEKLYLLDPLSAGFDADFKKLTKRLKKTEGGDRLVSRLFDLKRHEREIEANFQRLYNELDGILEDNLRSFRREADKKRMLKNASQTVGITIKPGTAIRYKMPGLWRMFGKESTLSIKDVRFEEVPIRDKSTGKIIALSVGSPIVMLSDGREMGIGRFKKWVDATDAVEEIVGLTDVMRKIGWDVFGLKLGPGAILAVPNKTRDPKTGEIRTFTSNVQIREIRDGRVIFERPVKVLKGPQEGTTSLEEQYVESMSFAEFVKWYRRMEVEKSLELNELRDVLKNFNKIYNKEYDIPAKENPVITLTPGEVLFFNDGTEKKFTIKDVGSNRVTLDSGESFTLPEFWFKII